MTRASPFAGRTPGPSARTLCAPTGRRFVQRRAQSWFPKTPLPTISHIPSFGPTGQTFLFSRPRTRFWLRRRSRSPAEKGSGGALSDGLAARERRERRFAGYPERKIAASPFRLFPTPAAVTGVPFSGPEWFGSEECLLQIQHWYGFVQLAAGFLNEGRYLLPRPFGHKS